MAAVHLMSALPSRMKDAGWGRILNIASGSAIFTPAEMTHYGVPKTAPLAVSLGFAKDAAGTGVTANSAIAGPPTPTRAGLGLPAGGSRPAVDGGGGGVHASAAPAVPAAAPEPARGNREHGRLPRLPRSPRRQWAARFPWTADIPTRSCREGRSLSDHLRCCARPRRRRHPKAEAIQ